MLASLSTYLVGRSPFLEPITILAADEFLMMDFACSGPEIPVVGISPKRT